MFRVPEKNWFIAIIILWVLIIGPGNIEGRIFPVAKDTEITASVSSNKVFSQPRKDYDPEENYEPGNNTLIWVRSYKIRECTPLRLEVFLIERNGHKDPVTWQWGPPNAKGLGPFRSGPWVIRIDINKFPLTQGDVIHKCSLFGIEFPWETRTRLW